MGYINSMPPKKATVPKKEVKETKTNVEINMDNLEEMGCDELQQYIQDKEQCTFAFERLNSIFADYEDQIKLINGKRDNCVTLLKKLAEIDKTFGNDGDDYNSSDFSNDIKDEEETEPKKKAVAKEPVAKKPVTKKQPVKNVVVEEEDEPKPKPEQEQEPKPEAKKPVAKKPVAKKQLVKKVEVEEEVQEEEELEPEPEPEPEPKPVAKKPVAKKVAPKVESEPEEEKAEEKPAQKKPVAKKVVAKVEHEPVEEPEPENKKPVASGPKKGTTGPKKVANK
jgi:hypothetical protein